MILVLAALTTIPPSSPANTPATTTTGTPSSSNIPTQPVSIPSGKSALNSSDKIALGVGLGVGIPSALAGIGACILQVYKHVRNVQGKAITEQGSLPGASHDAKQAGDVSNCNHGVVLTPRASHNTEQAGR